MGITSKSLHTLKRLIDIHKPKIVCDMGDQRLFLSRIHPSHPLEYDQMIESKQWVEKLVKNPYDEVYVSEMWKNLGIEYYSIDANKRNHSIDWDLSQPLQTAMKFDFVMDYGTGEHVMSLFQFFLNCHELCKVGGIMIHENPKTESWPLHGFHFFTIGFYIDLAKLAGYDILDIGENSVPGNEIDGWNVYAVLRKTRESFMLKEQFPKACDK